MIKVGLLLFGGFLLSVLVSFCLPDPRGGVPWNEVPRSVTGLTPIR